MELKCLIEILVNAMHSGRSSVLCVFDGLLNDTILTFPILFPSSEMYMCGLGKKKNREQNLS